VKFTAIINKESERAADWQKVFGTNKVEVCNFIPVKANVLGVIRDVYLLDLESLTDEQYERLLFHISEKFKVPLEEVGFELPTVGVPILAEDLCVSCDNPFFL